jgi:flavin reductase (DIM6/NTAB) family NADH-FMN oxidoreductase RutF
MTEEETQPIDSPHDDNPDESPLDYCSSFYPMHLALLAVERNVMPLAWWTPISKDPFRFAFAMDIENHTLILLRQYCEAVLHFMPWHMRQTVAQAGYISGARIDKARQLGLHFRPAEKLRHTVIIEGAYRAYELVTVVEMPDLSADHVLFVMEVVATHSEWQPDQDAPILFCGFDRFATLGERWRFRR